MNMPVRLLKTTLCLAVLGAVLGGPHRAAHAGLNSPVTIRADAGPSLRRTVLIYYANETPTDRFSNGNRQTIVEWLRGSRNGEALKLVEALQSDARGFPETVAREVAALQAAAAARAKSAAFGLVVFTNADARQSRFRYLRPGEEGPFHVAPLALPRLDDPILQASPLTEPHVFARALVAAARLFDPNDHQFVLITKSHGSPELALMPQLTFQANAVRKEAVLAVFDKEAAVRVSDAPLRSVSPGISGGNQGGTLDPSQGGTLDPSQGGTLDPSQGGTLDPSQGGTLGPMKSARWLALLVGKPLSAEAQAALVEEIENEARATVPASEPTRLVIGIPKSIYFVVLEQLGKHRGMRFPLVVVESCHSELSPETVGRLTRSAANLGVLYTSDHAGLKYETLDYAKVLAGADRDLPVAAALCRALSAKHLKEHADVEAGSD